MKIAVVIRRLDVKGGTQRQTISYVRELKKRGHRVKLYAIFYSAKDCYPELLQGLEVVWLDRAKAELPYWIAALQRLPLLCYTGTFLRIWHETKTAKRLAKLIDPDVDAINALDRVAHRVIYFFKKRVKDVPAVWNTNDTHSLRWYADKYSDVDPSLRPFFLKRLGYWLYDWYENWRYMSAVDAIAVVDRFNQGLVKKYFGRQAAVVRTGPDLGQFTFVERKSPQGKIRLLTSGIFFAHRRYEDAIEAVALLRGQGYDVELDIVGSQSADPAYAAKISQLIRSRRLEHCIHLRGIISEPELMRLYREDDIFLYPHHLQSNGNAPLEAMASGMPAIISKSAGAHENIVDHGSGLVIEPKNPKDLCRAIQELIKNPALYQKLSRGGSEAVRRNLSWERYTDGMLDIFNRLFVERASRSGMAPRPGPAVAGRGRG